MKNITQYYWHTRNIIISSMTCFIAFSFRWKSFSFSRWKYVWFRFVYFFFLQFHWEYDFASLMWLQRKYVWLIMCFCLFNERMLYCIHLSLTVTFKRKEIKKNKIEFCNVIRELRFWKNCHTEDTLKTILKFSLTRVCIPLECFWSMQWSHSRRL